MRNMQINLHYLENIKRKLRYKQFKIYCNPKATVVPM